MIIIICLYKWYEVFQFNTNNMHIIMCYQVFLSNSNNLQTIIWFQVTIPL